MHQKILNEQCTSRPHNGQVQILGQGYFEGWGFFLLFALGLLQGQRGIFGQPVPPHSTLPLAVRSQKVPIGTCWTFRKACPLSAGPAHRNTLSICVETIYPRRRFSCKKTKKNPLCCSWVAWDTNSEITISEIGFVKKKRSTKPSSSQSSTEGWETSSSGILKPYLWTKQNWKYRPRIRWCHQSFATGLPGIK